MCEQKKRKKVIGKCCQKVSFESSKLRLRANKGVMTIIIIVSAMIIMIIIVIMIMIVIIMMTTIAMANHHHHHNLQQVSVLWKVPSGASERTSRIKVAWLPQMQSNNCHKCNQSFATNASKQLSQMQSFDCKETDLTFTWKSYWIKFQNLFDIVKL